MLNNALPFSSKCSLFSELSKFNSSKFKRCKLECILMFEFFIFIHCIKLTNSQLTNFNPLNHGLCSEYLVGDLITTSVSTFKQLWLTSDYLKELGPQNLTFITYMDTLLKRDGSPAIDEEMLVYKCSDFGVKAYPCGLEIKNLVVRLSVFDGVHLHLFLKNRVRNEWRILVIDGEAGEIVFYDKTKSCEKKRRKNLPFYKQFYCIINRHLNLDHVKSLLMMNIDLRKDLTKSAFEVWCFFKNDTMRKIRFEERSGRSQLISLNLNSYKGITIASVQFLPNRLVSLNQSNPFFKRSIETHSNQVVDSYSSKYVNNVSDHQLDDQLIESHVNSNHSFHQFSYLKRTRRDSFSYNAHNFPGSNRPNRSPARRHKKNRKKNKQKNKQKNRKHRIKYDGRRKAKSAHDTDEKSRKSIDFHLRRLVMGLSAYLNSWNMTLDAMLSKLKEIKSKTFNMFGTRNQVIVFHKYFATFHNVEENFFIQTAPLPFVQPNQVFFGCPQPFCFLTTFDDLTFNVLTNELLIFRNQYYWKISIGEQRTSRQQPYIRIRIPRVVDARLISKENEHEHISITTDSEFPVEFPMYIDAATYIDIENFNYLIVIKDGWVFVYIPNTQKLVPLLLRDYFAGSMTYARVDTVLFLKKQLYVFSENHYWLYDLVGEIKLQLATKGPIYRNLPSHIDSSFTYQNRFYFFKQNFFYLNDAQGNSIINAQLVHGTFITGCEMGRLPWDVNMSELFKAPALISYYCMHCTGHFVEDLRDRWNWDKNVQTVSPNNDLEDRADLDGRIRINDETNQPAQTPAFTTKSKIAHQPILPIIPDRRPGSVVDLKTTNLPNVHLATESNKMKEESKKSEIIKTIDKIDEFALDIWTFITHHLFFGFLLLSMLILTIYLCQRGKNKYLPFKDNEDQMKRLGKDRRKEMIRRNRRWK